MTTDPPTKAAIQSERQTPEIEIAPEMIEAGLEEFFATSAALMTALSVLRRFMLQWSERVLELPRELFNILAARHDPLDNFFKLFRRNFFTLWNDLTIKFILITHLSQPAGIWYKS